jgi:hypothetical protein
MKRLITALLPLISILAFLFVAETGVRAYHYVRFGVPLLAGQPSRSQISTRLSPIALDDRLGWRATRNYRFEGRKRNSDDTEYEATISQDENGFRMYGTGSTGKPRMLVIGDSFTQAVEASDDKTYYAIVRDLLGVEVFAYGGGGYGTLQELMILDSHLDAIRPDIILWQFSTNDLVNNSPELEMAIPSKNNGMTRPYWVGDRVQYILPSRGTTAIRRFSLNYCRVCYRILHRLDRLRAASDSRTADTQTSTGEPLHRAFLDAVRTTDVLVGKMRDRAGAIPIVAFIVSTGHPDDPEYERALIEIAHRHGVIVLDDVTSAVAAARESGAVVTADDQVHWNEAGHQIAGRVIAAELRDLSAIERLNH